MRRREWGFDAAPGTTFPDALLEHGVEIEHACGKVGACTTCHVIVASGFESLNEVDDNERGHARPRVGLAAAFRLSCQALIAETDLTVEIPRYTLNLAKENG